MYQHPHDDDLKENATPFTEQSDASWVCFMLLAVVANWVKETVILL